MPLDLPCTREVQRSSNAPQAGLTTQRRLGVSPGGPKHRRKTCPGLKKYVRAWCYARFSSMLRAYAVRGGSPDEFFEGPTLENRAPTTAGARFWQKYRLPQNTKSIASGVWFLAQKLQKDGAVPSENRKKCSAKCFWDARDRISGPSPWQRCDVLELLTAACARRTSGKMPSSNSTQTLGVFFRSFRLRFRISWGPQMGHLMSIFVRLDLQISISFKVCF